jgi:hypothetical protein
MRPDPQHARSRNASAFPSDKKKHLCCFLPPPCRLCSQLLSHGAVEAVALLAAENLLKVMAKKPQIETSITREEPSMSATSVARQPSRAPISRLLLRMRQAEDCSAGRQRSYQQTAALVVAATVLQLVAVVHHGPAVEDGDRVLGLLELLLRRGRTSAQRRGETSTSTRTRTLCAGQQSRHLDVLRACPRCRGEQAEHRYLCSRMYTPCALS